MKKAFNRIDMSNKQFNSWLVIRPLPLVPGQTGGLRWLARCLECGEDYPVKGANLRSGSSKRCVKCGCGHAHTKQKGQIRTKRTSEEAAYHYLFLSLRKSARKRKINWKLSEEDVRQLVSKNCTYCDISPSLVCNPLKHSKLSPKLIKETIIKRNGIDRIDSSKGYEVGNCVSACEMCNKAKLDYSFEEFKNWVMRVAAHIKD